MSEPLRQPLKSTGNVIANQQSRTQSESKATEAKVKDFFRKMCRLRQVLFLPIAKLLETNSS